MEPVKLAASEVFNTVTDVHLADCYPRRPNASRPKRAVCDARIPSAFPTTAATRTYISASPRPRPCRCPTPSGDPDPWAIERPTQTNWPRSASQPTNDQCDVGTRTLEPDRLHQGRPGTRRKPDDRFPPITVTAPSWPLRSMRGSLSQTAAEATKRTRSPIAPGSVRLPGGG